MAITYDENRRLFQLDTENSSYLMAVDESGMLLHVWYGERLHHPGGAYLLRLKENPSFAVRAREKVNFLGSVQAEYPTAGTGDHRGTALAVRDEAGGRACELVYVSHEILAGKPALPGLPASFAGEEEGVETLSVLLRDPILHLSVRLLYTVFPKEDVIARSASISLEEDTRPLTLERALSVCLDMDWEERELISMTGSWARERRIQRMPIARGKFALSSTRGETSHQEHPFLAIAEPGADQRKGEVFGLTLVYSGNFLAQAERSQRDSLRLLMGINPEGFSWRLEPGASFQTPEAVFTYSAEGIGKMTRSFHDLIRDHVIRSPYKDTDPPVLINNWEATYFKFNTEKILELAKSARACGVEMFVLDDGWFGERDSDNAGLGDWIVNEKKLPGGMKRLGEEIHALGMKFGLWFEPEMVNPDSDLYRAHPDWALSVPGREGSLSRGQLVLDITRQEVRDYILDHVFAVLREGQVDYVKWDMNRNLSDVYSRALPPERQGEVCHRYCLAVYEMQERLLQAFPDLLLENCSGGGGRFDAGMLYYSPQIWTSDDTDAVERLRIQEGTAMVYPLLTMGAHVSRCPNEQVGRRTPFSTRGNVALAGTFGYELDPGALTEEERAAIRGQIRTYHRLHRLSARGDYYRIASWGGEVPGDAWMCVAKDRSEAVLTYVQVMGRPNAGSYRLKLQGLDPDAVYKVETVDEENGSGMELPGAFYGEELMKCGFLAPALGDFESRLYHLVRM